MFKIVQRSRDSWLDLAGGLRLQAVKYWTHAKHARSWSVMPAGALQDKKYKLAVQLPRGWNSQLSQAASPSRQPALFWKTWLFASHSLQYKYPLYPWNVESSQREYWKRNPREKQDWLNHNLHIKTLQIPLLSSSPLLHAWEVHYQNLFSPYLHLWEGHLVLGKQLGRDQFHISWYYGL